MDTMESLRLKITGAKDLKSVVKTMKAVAASNIGQYERAVNSLVDYNHTVSLGIMAYFLSRQIEGSITEAPSPSKKKDPLTAVIVFGSDQGLVGPYNNLLVQYVAESLRNIKGKKETWAVGENVRLLLDDIGLSPAKIFTVPNAVKAITPFVSQVLMTALEKVENNEMNTVYIFHNQPLPGSVYRPVMQQLLPLDENWRDQLTRMKWPGNKIPAVAGSAEATLSALIREYLFVSLFKASAESLASENASRLKSMQRAEKSIGDLLDELHHHYHRLRQESIDAELFDVVSGFEAQRNKSGK